MSAMIPPPEDEPAGPNTPKVRAEVTAEGLTVYHDSWPVQVGDDWSALLEFFGFDPAVYDVVDDSVKVSKWQTSKGNDDGGRDVIWLYSYRARFTRKALNLADIDDEAAIRALRTFRAPKTLPRKDNGAPVTYVHQQGDEQTGKGEGGGLEGLIERETRALEESATRLRYLLRAGWNVEGIACSNNGDRGENIAGHYASQPRTTATLRRQVGVSREMHLTRLRTFAAFGLPIDDIYTTSNHGEMRPGLGLSPVTSESDNLDLLIAESARDVVAQVPALADLITWHIPHDEWWTTLNLSGVGVGVTHGHKAGRKRLEVWVREQRDWHLFHGGFRMNLALLGHKHHGHIEDVSGTWLIQSPALDGGSPYFEALAGDRSASGVLSFLAGSSLPVGWGEFTVLGA